jgi:hypothetical protein
VSSIGSETFYPGIYTYSTTVSIASDVTFEGGPDDVFIMQIGTTLTQTANTHVFLAGCAQAKNIYWQVGTTTIINGGASMQGIILAGTTVQFVTGSSLVGSILTKTAANLDKTTITPEDTCTLGFGPTPAPSPSPPTEAPSPSPSVAPSPSPTLSAAPSVSLIPTVAPTFSPEP